MTTQQKLSPGRFWLFLSLALMVAIWLLRPMLLPFVAGAAIAYFLDPAVDKLVSWRMPRWLGTVLVLLGFVAAVTLLLLLIVPLIQSQMEALIQALPAYIETGRSKLMPTIYDWLHKLSPKDVEKLREAAGTYAGSAVTWAGGLLKISLRKASRSLIF